MTASSVRDLATKQSLGSTFLSQQLIGFCFSCGLNNRHLFLMALEAGKSKVEVPPDSVPGGGSVPGSQTATLSVSSHDGESILGFSFASGRQGRTGASQVRAPCVSPSLPPFQLGPGIGLNSA